MANEGARLIRLLIYVPPRFSFSLRPVYKYVSARCVAFTFARDVCTMRARERRKTTQELFCTSEPRHATTSTSPNDRAFLRFPPAPFSERARSQIFRVRNLSVRDARDPSPSVVTGNLVKLMELKFCYFTRKTRIYFYSPPSRECDEELSSMIVNQSRRTSAAFLKTKCFRA